MDGYVESGSSVRELKSSIVNTDLNALLRASALPTADVTVPSGVSSALIPIHSCLCDLI